VDRHSVDRELPQHLRDQLCQEQADILESEGLEVTPERLERRLATRVAHLSDDDIAALKAKSASRRLSRSITRSAARKVDGLPARKHSRSALEWLEGRAAERFRRK
jgi:hypothetical protein